MDYLFNPYGIYFHLITMESQITDLFGLAIYTDKGMYIGEVDDVVIDVDSKKIESLVVGKVNDQLFELKNYKGLKIPYRIISAIDDIVLIRHLPGAFAGSGTIEEE
ncbi:PRC-barrel domain protein [Methanoregula boonei 6A8]|uniref:PRC-barrel domain protein n=2 Tax=Methanoregula TaxID=395331 RepID=A7IAM4_METB6|nr:PRC-barrel domain protein [Methanoregula boonei 6A8]